MAAITVQGNEVRVQLTRGEKIAGLHSDLHFPLSAVKDVQVLADSFDGVRGLRAPGLALPGRTRIGTWRGRGGKTFAVARKGVPAIRLVLAGAGYRNVVVCVEDPAGTAAGLRAGAGLPPEPGFTEREVRFTSGGVDFAGTWTMPRGIPAAAALILPGSGPVDRNADHRRMPLGISRDLAHDLAARGVASLRYDKRGTGSSGGSFLAAGFGQSAEDAAAALHRMVAEAGEGLPVFVIGHSEGGYHAAVLASDPDNRLDGAVLLSTSAHSGFETARWQTARIVHALPAFPRIVLKLLRTDLVKQQAKSVAKLRSTTEDVVRMQGRRINARWQREFLDFDPAPSLARIQVPVLAVTGTKDLQVDPADLAVIAATVPGPVTTHEVADVSHLLRRDPGVPSLKDYKRQIREGVDAEVLGIVGAWILEHAGIRSGGGGDSRRR
ncbi:lysophospholipase [Arthrobacter sp. I2-34]|uniref:Lysophospholipase n=1 Tax=Arthrobacter hankyongi TaxID=2904801 RepID=A0ABS9LDA9_9MICC|nr:alpha/beta fold hydrolase [Arthrobacter hankyongi]MCG2624449.1 lysophospholipase [Arthrobacter hankyongi]